MKITVVGSGSWGTALANVLAQNGHDILIYGVNEDEIRDINENHMNQKYFENVKLNEKLIASTDYDNVLESEVILLAVPSGAIESVCLELNKKLNHPVYIINVAKGFHPVSHKYLMDVIEETLNPKLLKAVISLIGPSHAEEVVINQLTALNAVSKDLEAAQLVQELFSNDFFRVYTNTDVIGAQIGVAVKNIIALASGVASGLGYGDNTRAALITRGLNEMARYGMHFGGKLDTFLGLSGVGDLVVTATSKHSRNFQAGFEVAQAGGADNWNKTNQKTVEGVMAAKIVHEEALKHNIEMPITEQVFEVFYNNKDPKQAIHDLMTRELKHENYKK